MCLPPHNRHRHETMESIIRFVQTPGAVDTGSDHREPTHNTKGKAADNENSAPSICFSTSDIKDFLKEVAKLAPHYAQYATDEERIAAVEKHWEDTFGPLSGGVGSKPKSSAAKGKKETIDDCLKAFYDGKILNDKQLKRVADVLRADFEFKTALPHVSLI